MVACLELTEIRDLLTVNAASGKQKKVLSAVAVLGTQNEFLDVRIYF